MVRLSGGGLIRRLVGTYALNCVVTAALSLLSRAMTQLNSVVDRLLGALLGMRVVRNLAVAIPSWTLELTRDGGMLSLKNVRLKVLWLLNRVLNRRCVVLTLFLAILIFRCVVVRLIRLSRIRWCMILRAKTTLGRFVLRLCVCRILVIRLVILAAATWSLLSMVVDLVAMVFL